MTNGNGLVGMWKEFSKVAAEHNLNGTPEFKAIQEVYSEWYKTLEDDGSIFPKEGMSKWNAGIEIYQQMEVVLSMWEEYFSTTPDGYDIRNTINKEDTTMANKKDPEVKIPVSTKVIIGSAIVGSAIGTGLNKSYHKGIKPAMKYGVVPATKTLGKATAEGAKAFWKSLRNK